MTAHYLYGTIRILGHCRFRWWEDQADGMRSIEIEPAHCPACVAELQRQYPRSVLLTEVEGEVEVKS